MALFYRFVAGSTTLGRVCCTHAMIVNTQDKTCVASWSDAGAVILGEKLQADTPC